MGLPGASTFVEDFGNKILNKFHIEFTFHEEKCIKVIFKEKWESLAVLE